MLDINQIRDYLGDEADLLDYECKISKDMLYVTGPDLIEDVWVNTDRNNQVLGNLAWLYGHGRLANTGYVSILPVDQGIEHTGSADFAPNPIYFDSENIVKLAIDGGCNAVASTLGVLGSVSRKYAHKIPFIVKINHNEVMTYPKKYDQVMFANVEQAWDMGAAGVGATIYWGNENSNRELIEVSEAFKQAHELGMFTVLWCYVRNSAFRTKNGNIESSADATAQANYLGVTLEADLIKQKAPEFPRGFKAKDLLPDFGLTDDRIYDELLSDNPIDMTRYQVLHCYAGKIGLINSGGGSGKNDFAAAVRTAVVNKRGGGVGLIMGRKAFQRPMDEGVKIINAVQDVYLNEEVTVAE